MYNTTNRHHPPRTVLVTEHGLGIARHIEQMPKQNTRAQTADVREVPSEVETVPSRVYATMLCFIIFIRQWNKLDNSNVHLQTCFPSAMQTTQRFH